jgi:hypothetical protein
MGAMKLEVEVAGAKERSDRDEIGNMICDKHIN